MQNSISYCRECGEKLEGHYEHCPECGTRVHTPEANLNAQPSSNHPTQSSSYIPAVEIQSIDWNLTGSRLWAWIKRYKWGLTAALAVILLVVGFVQIGKYLTDVDRLVAKTESALLEKDAAQLATLLQIEKGTTLTLNEESLQPFIRYLESDSDALDELIDSLNDQASYYHETSSEEVTGDTFYNSLIHLRKDGKQLLFFNHYVLEMTPVYVDVTTNYEAAAIYLDDLQVAVADSSDFKTTIGPLLPGLYTFKSEFAGEYTSLRNEQDQVLTSSDDDHEQLDMYLDGSYMMVRSNYDEASIYIDGKNTGLATGEEVEIGPISMEGVNELYVEKEFPWGKVQSESLPVTDSYMYVELDPVNDAFQEAIMEATKEFILGWIDSLNTLDPTKARNLSGYMLESLTGYVQQYKDSGRTYQGKLNKVVFDLDSIGLGTNGDGNYTARVTVQNYAEEVAYDQGVTPEAAVEEANPMTYELIYTDGEWVVESSYNPYWFDDSHTKEVVISE